MTGTKKKLQKEESRNQGCRDRRDQRATPKIHTQTNQAGFPEDTERRHRGHREKSCLALCALCRRSVHSVAKNLGRVCNPRVNAAVFPAAARRARSALRVNQSRKSAL